MLYSSHIFTDTFRIMFTDVKYSDLGSNARAVEEQAYMYFVDFLEECETGTYIICYADCLWISIFHH